MFRGISTGDVDHEGHVNPPPSNTTGGGAGVIMIAVLAALTLCIAIVSCVASGGGNVW